MHWDYFAAKAKDTAIITFFATTEPDLLRQTKALRKE